jgi:hypothetical protein
MHANELAIRTAETYTCAYAPDGARALTGAQGDPVRLLDVYGVHLELPKLRAILQRFHEFARTSAHFVLVTSFFRPDFVWSLATNMAL